MTNLLRNLERYFATTPREQVLKDWEQTAKYDEIGITVDEMYKTNSIPPRTIPARPNKDYD